MRGDLALGTCLQQLNLEGRAAADFAVALNRAAKGRDDVAADGQSQARPRAFALRGEEGLKDGVQVLRLNARAVVADGQHHTIVVCRLRRHADLVGFVVALEGMRGIDDQVDEDLGVRSVVASFSADNTFGYAPLEVRFTNTSQNSTQSYWNFGDGFTSTVPNPIHTYDNAGVYSASLTVDGGATISQQIEAVIKPGVDFEVDDTTVDEGDEIEFRNVSYGLIYGYEWDFGDGNTSSLENPTHSYDEDGTYTVTLTVFGEAGPVATVKADLIEVDESSRGLFPGLGCAVTPAQGAGSSAAALALLGLGLVAVWRRRQSTN